MSTRITREENVRFLANLNNSTIGIKKLIQGQNNSAIPYIWLIFSEANHRKIVRKFTAGDNATIRFPDYGVVSFRPNRQVAYGPFSTRKLHFTGIPRFLSNYASWEATVVMMVPLEEICCVERYEVSNSKIS